MDVFLILDCHPKLSNFEQNAKMLNLICGNFAMNKIVLHLLFISKANFSHATNFKWHLDVKSRHVSKKQKIKNSFSLLKVENAFLFLLFKSRQTKDESLHVGPPVLPSRVMQSTDAHRVGRKVKGPSFIQSNFWKK